MIVTRQVIEELWNRKLAAALDPNDDLFDHGADSVMTLSVQLEAEGILKRQVATFKLMENPTIAGWAAVFDDPKSTPDCG
ncbi:MULTISPECIES: acyl carrier protein [unclassified Bradyrhizobium]|uniref:acyl carrier protein n=1 Tax=unclassified Bradyrhizobium TaxID=2631580 RepID=UPI0028EE9C56|nr:MULTISPECIES: acyl carrier protein [unclassified Bradyrhizobium]